MGHQRSADGKMKGSMPGMINPPEKKLTQKKFQVPNEQKDPVEKRDHNKVEKKKKNTQGGLKEPP